MKKILSLVLALCMLLGMTAFSAADELPTLDQIVLGENTELAADLVFAITAPTGAKCWTAMWPSSRRFIPTSTSPMIW